MSETEPQIAYTPDKVLAINTQLDSDRNISGKQEQALEGLFGDWEIEVAEEIDDQSRKVHVQIDAEESFGNFEFPHSPEEREKLSNLLATINMLVPFYPEDDKERVLAINSLHSHGLSAVVYPQLQRWLDAEGLPEEVAKDSVEAMALPFGKEKLSEAKKRFTYRNHSADGMYFSIGINSGQYSQFRYTRQMLVEGEESLQEGEIEWARVDLSTLGSCACLGVHGEERDHLLILADNLGLYEMHPHNIDFAHQSLSLLLGLGTLSYQAAQYEGTEDVFARAKILGSR